MMTHQKKKEVLKILRIDDYLPKKVKLAKANRKKVNMTSYYDDNFGFYDIESEEDIEFYHKMQDTNVEKMSRVRTICKNPTALCLL